MVYHVISYYSLNDIFTHAARFLFASPRLFACCDGPLTCVLLGLALALRA